jgi:two-component system sensor histidine kinase TctE
MRCADADGKDDALRAINQGVQHGIRLVNQLLTLSTAEVGVGHPLRKMDVNLIDVVQQVLENLAVLAQSKHIDLGVEHEGTQASLWATPSLIEELVANLVDNAIRYTPAGGIVTVVVATMHNRVQLRVEDNGPGIPEAERERVFERFYRLHEHDAEGWGLGLAIVREIAIASAAHVTLSEREVGPGLVASVTFSQFHAAPD